jgi:hypothetical protein
VGYGRSESFLAWRHAIIGATMNTAQGGEHDNVRREGQFPCPCCGFRTLTEQAPGTYEICELCGWEDDPVQFDDPMFPGGANRESLIECRLAFFSSTAAAELVKARLRRAP